MTSPARFRLLPAIAALALVACGDGRPSSGAATTVRGLDAVLLRLPSGGGTAKAHAVGSDSLLWQSQERAAGITDILGFDDFLGVLVAQDAQGRIVSVDLRLGTVETLGEERVRDARVAEGGAALGVDGRGRLLKLTSVSTWSWQPPDGASDLVPLPDGSLVVVSTTDNLSRLRRMVPPETIITDSANTAPVRLLARTMAGDRLWLVTDSALVALNARTLQQTYAMRLREPVAAIALTPSGDRVFLSATEPRIRVIDRYAEDEVARIDLPAAAGALRMDPDGRYLLAKQVGADTVFVVSLGTNRVVSTIATAWRNDLPLVTPSGQLLVARGQDAVLIDAESSRESRRYASGASDRWELIRWNGFRPRAAGLDRPVEFEEYAEDSARADSVLRAMIAARYGDMLGGGAGAAAGLPPSQPYPGESPAAVPPPSAAVPPLREPQRPREEDLRGTWSVSFATLLDEDRARQMADTIVVDGRRARVVLGNRDGVTVWRVLLGPYNSREAAERAGMRSRLSYWVFEGAP